MKISNRQYDISVADRLVVAVSGGSDSVCLLHLLRTAGFKKVVVAHLDHQIRRESYHDAQLVKGLADYLEYECVLRNYDVKSHALEHRENLEAVGRKVRYQFFRELKEEYEADYVVTAHHADDQVETVLLNIIRGCGLDGLQGMKELDHDLWRPLLPYSKQEILDYCHDHQLPFVHESTNFDATYRRNFLRLQVIPQLKKLNPNLLETMRGNIQVWQMAVRYFDDLAKGFLGEYQHKSGRYRLKPFLELKLPEQQMVLRSLYEQVHGNKKNLTQDHLDQVLKVLHTNVTGKKKEFGPGKVLVRGRGWFEVIENEKFKIENEK